MSRTVVQPNRAGLALILALCAAACIGSAWICIDAVAEGGFVTWIVAPVALLGVFGFGGLCWWSAKRRANDEPALIVDEVGIFDNVSIVSAGRVKWRDAERVWLFGPNWMQLLCIRPDNIRDYMAKQDDTRGLLMRLNKGVFGAPVVVPMMVLGMPQEQIWSRIAELAGAPLPEPPSGRFVTGA